MVAFPLALIINTLALIMNRGRPYAAAGLVLGLAILALFFISVCV
ncbi:MAG TPA: hypothetical protein P5186_09635 [Candidatus Paceibacterota bacterium]|nr:hypothetical protein [Verrucomicrobiota bacterium]HRY48296.1 hypothetical protein [Candidatus Paceibacterota bacterium]HSA02439.1 hypothetical protein [Candidatus Paceibacterota bacterium]